LPARELYTSPLFSKLRAFVERRKCPWFILSAEHGLVHPDTVIAPYERTLNTMGVKERRAWAELVTKHMDANMPDAQRITVLAGQRYREFLLPYLRRRANVVEMPMEGMPIGERVRRSGLWNNNHVDEEYDPVFLDELLARVRGWPGPGIPSRACR
jgi:hypothetical protein